MGLGLGVVWVVWVWFGCGLGGFGGFGLRVVWGGGGVGGFEVWGVCVVVWVGWCVVVCVLSSCRGCRFACSGQSSAAGDFGSEVCRLRLGQLAKWVAVLTALQLTHLQPGQNRPCHTQHCTVS